MSITLRDAEVQFLRALHQATERKLIMWTGPLDDERAVFQADVDGERVVVEFIHFPVASGEVYERVVAQVSGLKASFQVAVGTEAYDVISSMLSINIFGWAKGRTGTVSDLENATRRVRRLLGNQ